MKDAAREPLNQEKIYANDIQAGKGDPEHLKNADDSPDQTAQLRPEQAQASKL